MRIIPILLTSMCLFIASSAFSQEYEIPDYTLEAKEDYAKFEKDIIAAAKWLTTVPLNEQPSKRQEVAAFVMKWVNGSRTVNVELNQIILEFEEKNPGMLIIYMATSAKYVLENNYSKDMRAKHTAALRAMMSVYKSGNGIKKDKKMEKLIKSDEERKLEEWMNKNLKVGAH